MINKPVHFGKTLRKYIEDNEISVTKFAKDLDLKREYIYSLYKKPLFAMALTLRICEYLELPLTFFVSIDGETIKTKKLNINTINTGGSEDIKKLRKERDTERDRVRELLNLLRDVTKKYDDEKETSRNLTQQAKESRKLQAQNEDLQEENKVLLKENSQLKTRIIDMLDNTKLVTS